MRNSTLLKWAQNSTNNKNAPNKNGGTDKNWIHPPDALQKGHIAYLVKYLGSTDVDQPKGIQVVKDAASKLKFSQQLKKSEGTKIPKVELTISIDGVAIQEPKTKTKPKRIMHQYPLHRISYCADDKSEKKFFSFIAKEEDADKHMCFVFVSDKLAEEITLTIGQAFGLAYRRFLETSGKDLESQRRCMVLQQKIRRLELENNTYRQRLQDICAIKGTADVQSNLTDHDLPDILHVPIKTQDLSDDVSRLNNNNNINTNGNKLSSDKNGNTLNGSQQEPPPVPPRSFEKSFDENFLNSNKSLSTVLTRVIENKPVENQLIDDEFDEDFNPRAYEAATNGFHHNNMLNGKTTASFPSINDSLTPPLLAPPPKAKDSRRQQNGMKKDLFGSTPFNPTTPTSTCLDDPFEMGEFSSFSSVSNPSQQELENAIGLLDKRILEMKNGFSQGLSIGSDDFSLESLDPLRN